MPYFTTPSYLAAPCGLANPQGFHGAGLDLSIQAERSVGQGIALYPTYDWDASAAGDSARLSLQRSDMSIAARYIHPLHSSGVQCSSNDRTREAMPLAPEGRHVYRTAAYTKITKAPEGGDMWQRDTGK